MALLLIAFKSLKGAQQPNQRSFVNVARLRASLMYVKSIETFRLLFISMLGVGTCFVLLLSSLMLFHAAVFLYAPWSPQAKLWFGLCFSLGYLLIVLKISSYVFSEEQWLKIFHAEDIAEHIAGQRFSQTSEEEFTGAQRPFHERDSTN